MRNWLVKLRRYTGGESVIGSYDTEGEAQEAADDLNKAYQSDTHYVERWDPEKFKPWRLPKRGD